MGMDGQQPTRDSIDEIAGRAVLLKVTKEKKLSLISSSLWVKWIVCYLERPKMKMLRSHNAGGVVHRRFEESILGWLYLFFQLT